MSEILIASVVSLPGPLPNQDSRSSDNFITTLAPSGTTGLRVVVESTLDVYSVPYIVFDIAEDKSGSDAIIYRDVRNGYTLGFQAKQNLYIIAKGGTTKPFNIMIYAIV
ncbi:hypothetical protein BW897_30765 [Bacillus cereus]|uniref:Uncharacterized protein n=1 Tax=Bacillus cereus TaxID=1396 RepID=A0A1S9T9F2_BACCE|nr:hypothetical protein [Bacillus cereus]OOR06658.1 hypothetical protein BW897_30765 [Bacillus cereus]